MTQSFDDRLKKVLAQVFGVVPDAINDQSSADSIPGWDSANHINLIMAIESEFKVSLSANDTIDMLSVSLIKSILSEQGVQ